MQQNFHRNSSFSAPAGGGFLFSKIFAIINKISLPFTAKNLYFCPFTNIVGNMKTRIFLLSLSLLLAMTLQAQTYSQLWKNVEQIEQQDLPKAVIAEASKIYRKAKTERNVPQMMKAYLTMMEWRGSISPDSVAVDVKGLEAWAEEPGIAIQNKAVLNSILGGIFIREDFAKGNQYLNLSLKDSLKLVNYPADKLVPMVESGETSRLYFDNNLYDLLARRAIQLWNENRWNVQQEDIVKTIQQTYQSLLHLYKAKGMRPAWLLTALDAYPQADEKQLREWIKEYADLDVCAEVYLRLANAGMKLKTKERLALLQEAIRRYPHYNRINALKNEERKILNPRLQLELGAVYPESPIRIEASHANLSGIQLKVYRVNLPVESPSLRKTSFSKTIGEYGTLIRDKHFDLPATPDYEMRKDAITLEGLGLGLYYALATPDGHRDAEDGVLIHVTGMQMIHRALPENKQEIVVLDKRSGHPVPGAEVRVYQVKGGGYELKESHVANAEGVVMLPKGKERTVCLQAQTAMDKAMSISHAWMGDNNYKVTDKTEGHVELFTDRGIYRPGQTLHYSGIVYSQRKDDTRAKEGATYTISLMDADGKLVEKQEVKTDAYGSFSGTLELPKSGKMGRWRLQTKGALSDFRVEEYKRPTFEVTFDTVRTSYRAGDSILVTGMARTFAGAPVQGAKVNYQVVRLENSYWRIRGTETNRVAGEAVTDNEGRFEVPVHFLPIKEGVRSWYYTYEVSADVTSLAGETQEGTLDLPLGSSSLKLFISDWEGKTMIKEYPKQLTFRVSNLMNVPMDAEVEYEVLSQGKVVLQGKQASNKPFIPEDIYALPSGHYQLKARVKDEQGKENDQTVTFTLLSLNDNRLPEGTDVWYYQPSEEFGTDGTAIVYFGSSEKDVYLFYDVMSGNGQMERKHLEFSDSLLSFRYTYREEYGDGLRCSFAFLKNGKLHTKEVTIQKPKPNKTLQLKWKTFRDKLQPGAKETWTLSILRPDGKPADAQLLATMYDASLDRLTPHAWHFGLNFARRFPNFDWMTEYAYSPYWYFSFPIKMLKFNPLSYSTLEIPKNHMAELQGMRMYKAAAAFGSVRNTEDMVVFEEEIVPTMQHDSVVEEANLEFTDKVQLRTNFAETVFFYPQLRTDANGEVSIEFTLPESLTEWKFMGLAHTKDMDYGSLVDKVVASKEFMLQPNLPRFVRVGDQVSITASLINLSDKEAKGVARMEIFVPNTEKVILSQKSLFVVKAGETGKVSFSFQVSDKYEGLAVRMVADGDMFSDGEQRYLPVLSNKQKLTESVLLNVNGKGTFKYSLESLFNRHSSSVSHPKMVVEFTGNPVWYAVQALKVVANPENDNALSWASAYYANALLSHLAKAEPRIADSLKVEGMDTKLAEATLKLKDLQNADGSWSWYKGMGGSLYMTTSITQLIARLQQLTDGWVNTEVVKMNQQAWGYLNKRLAEEVQEMKEAEKKGAKDIEPSEVALQCLYTDALEKNLRIPTDVRNYLIGKLEGMSARLTIYGKALSAIVLKEAGQEAKANEFLESLMQYSVANEEMGRYFDSPKAHYSWFSYRIPTQVAAIEAIKRITDEENTLEEMKQWLLKQKQAQAWETPVATTDAVYALLTTGKDWLANSGAAIIRVGKEVIQTPADALGYVRQEVSGNVLKIRQATVTKESAGIGWGAVYAEFEEDMDKVSAQGNALKVARNIYKDGKPLAEGDALMVGDKLEIRLTVVADRDMDFVQVKDERAACMEPVDALSGYRWHNRIGYYQETKDSSTTFFIDQMRKGAYEFSYDVYVTSLGVYQQGIPTAKSVYAPEFAGHGEGGRLMVK